MPILRSRAEKPVEAAPGETEASCDILTLRRLSNHPAMEPLMARKEVLDQRVKTLEGDHGQYGAVLADFERSQALALAEQEPEALRQQQELKAQVAESAEQKTLVETGLSLLGERIEEALSAVRSEVEQELNAKLRPHIESMVESNRALAPHNAAVQQIARASQRLLGHASWELVDKDLGQRQHWLELKQANLARAAGEGPDAAA